jgi:sigma-B regulation protein RsbU (phosphoserine phosphatase)
MAFAVYDTASRELCLASAGFPKPLLVRNGRAELVDVSGVPLGLFPDSTYESKRLNLVPGDVIVFCSDGVHEQTNALDEEFGINRLVSRLAEARDGTTAERIAEDIVRAIDEHAGENAACRECMDDRTIVILRIGERGDQDLMRTP